MGTTFDTCRVLRLEMVEIYWLLLTPVTLLAMIFEFFKQQFNFAEILKRVFLSLFLLWSFEDMCTLIAIFSDGIVERMGGMEKFEQVAGELKNSFKREMPSMAIFRQMFIYFLNFISYLIALFSFYFTGVVTNFIYSVLYVVSPLAFLCIIPGNTMHIAKNLYKGLVNVAVWRILWSILGAILLEFPALPRWTGAIL